IQRRGCSHERQVKFFHLLATFTLHSSSYRSPKKSAKSKKTSAPDTSAPEPSHPLSSKRSAAKDSPITLTSEGEEEKPGHTPRRYTTVVEGGKRKKVVDIVRTSYLCLANYCQPNAEQTSFHPELQDAVEELKAAIANGARRFPQ